MPAEGLSGSRKKDEAVQPVKGLCRGAEPPVLAAKALHVAQLFAVPRWSYGPTMFLCATWGRSNHGRTDPR